MLSVAGDPSLMDDLTWELENADRLRRDLVNRPIG